MPPGNGDSPRELFLIDGNSLAYRAFFALPESISTSDGRPTNAIFGFASMLVKVLTDYGQVPTVVVWDAGMSGRKEISPDYKAQRSSRPDLLKLQWPHLRPLVEAFGYRNISVEGFEADDVIAALTVQAKERGVPVMVVTGDRDAYQLVDDGVRIMSTSRGVTDTKIYDREAVIERYGIPPELVPDFIGLKGDTSDNIPGVPGIGDKTAADLLQKFGDLEGVLTSVDKITGAKRKQNLIDHADNARMSKLLATMVRDVPVDIDLEVEFTRVPDRSNLRTVFRDWELRDPLRRLEEALEAAELETIPRPEDVDTIKVKTGLARHPTDITRMKGDEIVITLAAPEIPEGELIPREPMWRFAAYGGRQHRARGGDRRPEARHRRPRRPSRDRPRRQAARRRAGQPRLRHRGRGLPARPGPPRLPARRARRGARDRRRRRRRARHLRRPDPRARQAPAPADPRARPDRADGHGRARRSCTSCARPRRTGIKLDTKQLETVATRIRADVVTLEREIWDLAGEEFVIGSPQQLGAVLFEKLELSRKRRGKTGFSTDAKVLQAIRDEHPIIPKIERFRELSKLAQTYLDALPNWIGDRRPAAHHVRADDGGDGASEQHQPEPAEHPDPDRDRPRDPRLLHPRGRETSCSASTTTRSSCGSWPTSPTSRCCATSSCAARTSTPRPRARSSTSRAEQLDVGMRSKAKMVNYGIVYGLSAFGLADRLQIPQDEAQEFIDRYLERFPAVAQFMKDAVEQAEQHGYVSTLLGRRRQIPELRARNWQMRKLGERLAVNTVIQGTAADIIKVAMVNSHNALAEAGLTTRTILQIHDELLFEGPPEEMERATEIVTREMVGAAELDPPLTVNAGVGDNWLDAK